MTHSSRNVRGMTLVELMVTLAILSLVIAGVMNTLYGFQAIHTATSHQRQMNASLRTAVGFLDRDLRNAGFGIDPALAFDFTVFGGAARDPNPADGTVVAVGTATSCTNPGSVASTSCKRDYIDGPDELVFYARDGRYWGKDVTSGPAGQPEGHAWSVAGVAGGSVTLKLHGGDYLGKGQILQLVCFGGSRSTYVTINETVDNLAGGPTDRAIALRATEVGNPFRQNAALADASACFRNAETRAFQINRYRYHIRELHLDEAVASSAQPFLVLDQGIDRNGDGTIDGADLIPIAMGIVDMQVEYVAPTSGPSPRMFSRVGGVPGTLLALCAVGSGAAWEAKTVSDVYNNCAPTGLGVVDFNSVGASRYPAWQYSALSTTTKLRNSQHAGNVGSVHVALVGRTLVRVRDRAPTRQPRLLNRTAASIPAAAATSGQYLYDFQEIVAPISNTQTRNTLYL